MKEAKPVHFKQENCILKGDNPDINELPAYKDGVHIVSCWKFPFLKRIKMLFTGKVWLVVLGTKHPPLWIDSEAF